LLPPAKRCLKLLAGIRLPATCFAVPCTAPEVLPGKIDDRLTGRSRCGRRERGVSLESDEIEQEW
jgi:hypothetical protein